MVTAGILRRVMRKRSLAPEDTHSTSSPRLDTGRKFTRRHIGYIVAGALLFCIGMAVGHGDITLTTGSGYRGTNRKLPANLDYSSVEQVYDTLRENYSGKLTQDQLLTGLKDGLANATKDPYTEYFSAEEAQQFKNQLNNTFSGVGAELGKNSQGNLVIVAPIKGYPAEKAGLQAKDVITEINGKSTAGFSIEKAVTLIRGKKGTKVSLTIVRDNTKQLTLTMTRQDIHIPSITTKMLDNNIGYIQISSFADDTEALMNDAAQTMTTKGAKGIILDLRSNPGGLLSAAVSVSSHWLPDNSLILQEKRGDTLVDQYNSEGTHDLVGIPTVVLINEGSASASEITAGALRDNNAAYLIGQKSFGKGVVQQIIGFNDGSELKVTVASWYRPNGQNIHKKGIKPDEKIIMSDKDAQQGNDTQKTAAINYLLSKQ